MLSGNPPSGSVLTPDVSLTIDGIAAPAVTDWSFTRDLAIRVPGVDDVAPAAGEGEASFGPPVPVARSGPSPWGEGVSASPEPGASAALSVAVQGEEWQPVASCRVDSPQGSMWDPTVGVSLIDAVDDLSRPLGWEPYHAIMPGVSPGQPLRHVGLSNIWVIDRAMRSGGYYTTPPATSMAALHVPMVGSILPRIGILEATPDHLPDSVHREGMPQAVGMRNVGKNNRFRMNQTDLGNWEASMELDTSTDEPGIVHWWIIDQQGAGNGYRLTYSQATRIFSVWKASADSADQRTVSDRLVSAPVPKGEHRVTARFRYNEKNAPEVTVRLKGGTRSYESPPIQHSKMGWESRYWRAHLDADPNVVVGAFLIDSPGVPWATLAHTPNAVIGWSQGSTAPLVATPRILGDMTALDVLRDYSRAQCDAWGFDEQGRLTYRSLHSLVTQKLARTITSEDLIDYSWAHDTTQARSYVTLTYKRADVIARKYPSITAWQGSGDTVDTGERGSIVMAPPDADTDWIKPDFDVRRAGYVTSEHWNNVTWWNRGYGSWDGATRLVERDGQDPTEQWAYGVPGDRYWSKARVIDKTTLAIDYSISGALNEPESIELRTPEAGSLRRKGSGLPILRCYGITKWRSGEQVRAAGPTRAPRLEHDVGWMVQDYFTRERLVEWLAKQVSTTRARLHGIKIKPDPRLQIGDLVRVVDARPDGTEVDVTGLITRKHLQGAPGVVEMEIDIMEVEHMANEYGPYMDSRASTQPTMSGFAMRFDDPTGAPRVHANAQHISVGVRDITVTDRGVEISHDGGPIVSMVVTPDETLIERGLKFGLSGGGGNTVLRIWDEKASRYLDLRKSADWDRVRGPYCNLWIVWLHALGR